MNKYIFLFLITLISAEINAISPLQTGKWKLTLHINNTENLVVNFKISKEKKKYNFTVINANEIINLELSEERKDSIVLKFPMFNSAFILARVSKKRLEGNWYNYNKGANYRIPAEINYLEKENITIKPTVNLNGKWQTTFSPNTKDSYQAVGVFEQKNEHVTGTFLTETGDFRYLEGEVCNNEFNIGCLDGSHAFLFKGKIKNDSIYATFYSGKHYSTTFNAARNENASLKDPEKITYLTENKQQIQFDLKDLQGNLQHFPNDKYKNKVVIIQIMGTWCPNCLDETKYFKTLYEKYHQQGLEIISIGYEMGKSQEEYAEKIKTLRDKLNLKYDFLVGGAANKSTASQQFNMLNEIISFPTAIFIDKDGNVARIHTGFSGPGTGAYYTEYIEKTNALIEELLKK